jgi:hypothetical protein
LQRLVDEGGWGGSRGHDATEVLGERLDWGVPILVSGHKTSGGIVFIRVWAQIGGFEEKVGIAPACLVEVVEAGGHPGVNDWFHAGCDSLLELPALHI